MGRVHSCLLGNRACDDETRQCSAPTPVQAPAAAAPAPAAPGNVYGDRWGSTGTTLKMADSVYNPEWTPDGNEAAVDSNTLPWIDLHSLQLAYSGLASSGFGPGVACKPLRASDESGAFTMLVKLQQGAELKNMLHLGAADLYVLDGKLQYGKGSTVAPSGDKVLTPGYWGYIPAMSKAKSMRALEETELLMSFYGQVAFLDSNDKLGSFFTATDLKRIAKENGVTLLPQTLADALEEPSEADRKTAAGGKLGISQSTEKRKNINDCLKEDGGSLSSIEEIDHHFVDTRKLPWIVQGEDPKTCVSLKVVRVSPETGVVTAIVRQNGQAPPHYHLGAADFFITSGRIGYRAGPSDGYGPGVYMFEPAGARHEATQRVGDEDLIYTANIFGPIQFDSGVGTPPLAVLSWMTYLQFAKDSSTPLIRNRVDGSYLAAPEPPTNRFADEWFRKFDTPTEGFIDAKGNGQRLPLRLESSNVFVYGTVDADKMWKEFKDEPFEPVRVGGKAVVNIWFNNFTDTDCGGEYFETWYNTFVTAKGEPLELPMESPMSLIINDPKVKIYLMRVTCGDTPRNPGAADKAITGGRAIWGFPKHPIPGKLCYQYTADKKNMKFTASHLDRKAVTLSVRLPEADEGAISIPMDITSADDTCIGAPMNGGTHKNDNGAHQTRYGMAFASTHHFKFWDAKTDSIEFGVDDHYAQPIKRWGFQPMLKAHTSNMKIAASKPCQWISGDEVAPLVAEQDKLGAIGGMAKTQLRFTVPVPQAVQPPLAVQKPRFADEWFRKFDKPTDGFIDAKGNGQRLPLRLESTNVFVYGTVDAKKMWKEFQDEAFEPVRVGGKAVVSVWFNNFTDTDCGGEYFETWYNTFVTAKGEPLELPMESPMSLIINDPKVMIYLMRVTCGDTTRNPGAADKAITGGRAIWGFPKHPIPGKLSYEYTTDKKNMTFTASHLDKKAVKLSVRLPEADEGAISIPLDVTSAEDTCIGAPMNGGTHKNDNGAHQTRYGMAFASTHHFKFWDTKTDSIEFGADDHYAAPIKRWGFQPMLKAHTTTMKIAAMKPCQWISGAAAAKLVAEQNKLGAIGGKAKTALPTGRN